MAQPVTWVREGHTKAKHDLLLGFFNKWVSIHSSYFVTRGGGLVRIFDGFAGPGIYADGELGSPRILLEALLANPNLLSRWSANRYDFSFVEQDSRRAQMLKDGLDESERRHRLAGTWSERITWTVTTGRYEDHVPAAAAGVSFSSLFLFLDPFGYSHSPMTLTRDLVQLPKCDTLIFLPLSFVHRFVGQDELAETLDRFFGSPDWRTVPNGPGRPQALLDLFQKQLRDAGLKYTLPFRLKPDAQNEYYIVGASAHPKGLESIKEGYWTVDEQDGLGYQASRPAPEGQASLFGEEDLPKSANTRPLLEALRSHFGERWFSVEDAVAVTAGTRFLETHLRTATLVPSERDERLEVQRPPGTRGFPSGRSIRMRFVRPE
jgi:three-Cys-motif partner protein